MKKLLLGLNIVGLLMIVAVGYNVGSVYRTKPIPLVEVAPASPAPTAHPAGFHTGDSQKLDGVDILLNNVYTMDGKYFVADFTITNHSGASLDAVWLRRSVNIYVDTQDWRTPVADSWSDIPDGETQTGHVEFTWSNPEVVDTVRFGSLVWFL